MNCGINSTVSWRKTKDKKLVCNACGLYYKLNGLKRPETLNRTPQKRRRTTSTTTSTMNTIDNQQEGKNKR